MPQSQPRRSTSQHRVSTELIIEVNKEKNMSNIHHINYHDKNGNVVHMEVHGEWLIVRRKA